jgi:DsbC/DsbD-like thiol-disulfide interchange protein
MEKLLKTMPSRSLRASMHARLWAFCGILLMSPLSPAAAADASAWDKGAHSALRLVAGHAPPSGKIWRAGISLEIEQGWKTYWRYPGDSGVPPHFDFSGSTNVDAVAVEWPAPQAFEDGGGGIAIGYKHAVIFPLKITPREAGKPVVLNLSASYAVCEKLCVPATGKAVLTLDGGPSSHADAIAEAEAKVPQVSKPGATSDLALLSLHREDGTPKKAVVDIRAAPGEKVHIFVEGPSPAWALPLPHPQPGAPAGQQRFAFALDGVPSGATLKGAELRFTIVGADKAIDVRARLD